MCVANTNTQHAAHIKRIAHTINDRERDRGREGEGRKKGDSSSVGVAVRKLAYLSDVCHDVVDFFMA